MTLDQHLPPAHAVPAPAGTDAPSTGGRTAALVMASAAFLDLKDTNAIVVALPIMAPEFGVPPIHLSVLITAYILVLALFIPLSGWFADRFGARTVFQAALAVFIAGSVCCALSTSLGELTAARIVQAAGGSFMTPVARIVLVRRFPRAEFVTLMAWFGIPMLLGPLASPLIGGAFATHGSWTWIFWMNVPLGLLILALSFRFVPPVPKSQPRPLDRASCALLMAGLCALMAGLESVDEKTVHPAVAATLVAGGLLLLAGYAVHARGRPGAPLDLGLLALPSFRLTMIGSFVFFTGSAVLPFLVPTLLQTIYRYDALTSGLITVASVAGALAGRPFIGWLVRVLTPVPFMIATALLAGLATAVLAVLDARTGLALFVLALVAGGFFSSLYVTALGAMTYAEIGDDRAGEATSFAATVQQVGMGIGVAFTVIVVYVLSGATGGAMTRGDFAITFILAGALCAATAVLYPRIPPVAAERLVRPSPPAERAGRN